MGEAPRAGGVVAAGSRWTARAGAQVLRAGGNAVDAAVAAAFASCIAEPMLTGMGGGGYLLADGPRGSRVYDFFVAAPGLGRRRPVDPEALDFRPVVLDFGDTTQVFHAGLGAAAVPGFVHGLCTAHEREGRLPLGEVLAPAIELARHGALLSERAARTLAIIAPIFEVTPQAHAIVAPEGRLLRAGQAVRRPALADFLEALGREGPRFFYEGPVAEAIVRQCRRGGGLITRTDLRRYRTAIRAPLAGRFRGARVLVNPPPSTGGALVAFGLALLDAYPAPLDLNTPAGLRALADALAVTAEARAEVLDPAVLEGGYRDDSLGQPGSVDAYRRRLGRRRRRAKRGATTHISAADADGMFASVTTSNGEGCGHVVDGFGIHLNNMLGEEDINPGGFHRHPAGARLPSMMCPTVIEHPDGARTALGSGGANRLRTAILQVCLRVVEGQRVGAAVCAPRIHFEDDVLDAEPGFAPAALGAVEAAGYRVRRWRELNLYFGGVHAVHRDARGALSGGGDPRRDGHVVFAEEV